MLDGDFWDSVTTQCLLKPYANALPVSVVIRLPSQAAVLSLGLENRRNDAEEKGFLEVSKVHLDVSMLMTYIHVDE